MEEKFNMPRVLVKNEGISWRGTECYIDGKRIDRVRSVDFHVAADEVSQFTFEMMAMPEINMTGEIFFRFAPQTVEEATEILRHEMINCRDVYNGFVSSVESALKEAKPYTPEHVLAKNIVKRIIGEE